MEKFKHTSPWPQIFIEDYAIPDIEIFSYEGEVGIPRVIVSKTPEVTIQDFGDHCPIIPFKMESMEQFDALAIEVIIKAHEIAGTTVKTLEEATFQLDKVLGCGRVNCILTSKEDYDSSSFMKKIYNVLGDYISFRRTYHFPQIKKGEAFVLPESDFIGVIPTRKMPDGEEWRGIGIINTRAVVKIVFEE